MQTRPNDPGQPTVARTYILNSGPAETIPVTLHAGTDVQPVAVMSVPPVSLAPATVVTTRAGRMAWEYRQVMIAASSDESAVLNAAGEEGWEAVGLTSTARGVRVLLKRPR